MQTNTVDVKSHKRIQELLDTVLSRLHQARITRSSEVIECIASLLLEMTAHKPLNKELNPHLPPSSYGGYEIEVRQYLEEASNLTQGAENLFDRYVLFQSFEVEQKGSYPIPRHIIRFMLDTLQIRPNAVFADFTCGSGGFLVYRNIPVTETEASNYGVDIAPELVRIAYANVVLHGMDERTKLFIGDSFRICNDKQLALNTFDYIAMAPPFGIAIDKETALKTTKVTTGRTSEQLFIRLALKKLRENGKAIIMVPNTLLTINQRTEKLKRDIFNNHTLRAVISLGEGALYPFNNLDTGLLLLEKDHSPTTQPWLFNVENDGYTRSRRRDITQDPDANDFASILNALNATNFNPIFVPQSLTQSLNTTSSASPLSSASIQTQEGQGCILKLDEQAILQAVWLIEDYKQDSEASPDRYLFALVDDPPSHSAYYIVYPLNPERREVTSGLFSPETNTWLEQRPTNNRSGTVIFFNQENSPGQTVAILPDGRLLGCTRPLQSIRQAAYDLRPSEFLRSLSPGTPLTREQLRLPEISEQEVKELAVQGAAGFLIAEKTTQQEESAFASLHKVKLQQDRVRHHADYLLGQLEMRPFEEMPPRTAHVIDTLRVLKLLDKEQSAIWKTIQQFAIYVGKIGYPYHFTSSMLYQSMNLEQRDAVKLQSTLDLLEQLGVIVRVNVHPDFSTTEFSRIRSVVYYRMVTEYDIVPPPAR